MVTAARRAIESLYDGTCTIIVQEDVKDPVTKITGKQEVTLARDVPCRLSYKTIAETGTPSPVSAVTQTVKLFLAPEVDIPAGSKITVMQNGRGDTYQRSGKPALYPTHQEIMLTAFERWA